MLPAAPTGLVCCRAARIRAEALRSLRPARWRGAPHPEASRNRDSNPDLIRTVDALCQLSYIGVWPTVVGTALCGCVAGPAAPPTAESRASTTCFKCYAEAPTGSPTHATSKPAASSWHNHPNRWRVPLLRPLVLGYVRWLAQRPAGGGLERAGRVFPAGSSDARQRRNAGARWDHPLGVPGGRPGSRCVATRALWQQGRSSRNGANSQPGNGTPLADGQMCWRRG